MKKNEMPDAMFICKMPEDKDYNTQHYAAWDVRDKESAPVSCDEPIMYVHKDAYFDLKVRNLRLVEIVEGYYNCYKMGEYTALNEKAKKALVAENKK